MKFNEFWPNFDTLFKEFQIAIQEKKHASIQYLPFTISIWEIVDKVAPGRPAIIILSPEWVWLQ